MRFRMLLVGFLISLGLAACGVQDAPLEQSLAETAAPDEPVLTPTPPATLEQTPPARITREPTQTTQPTATSEPATATVPAPTLVVQETGRYTMSIETMPSHLAAWSPDGNYLLTTNVNQPPWLSNLALGRAFIVDLQTGTSSVVTDPIIVGYNIGSYVFPYQEPEWLPSGIRLSRPNAQNIPELVEINPHTSEQAERVLAELGTGTFHSRANGDVLTLNNTTLKRPNAAAQPLALPTDPQVAWMTHFSDDMVVYVPNTRTINLHTLATGAEQTWTLDQLPELEELCCIEFKRGLNSTRFARIRLSDEEQTDIRITNVALSPDSKYLAVAIGHKFSILDVWLIDTHTLETHFIERDPMAWWTYLEWSPDSTLLAYTGRFNDIYSKGNSIWKLYDPSQKQIVYTSQDYAISFAWNNSSTRIAILKTHQKYIKTYEIIK